MSWRKCSQIHQMFKYRLWGVLLLYQNVKCLVRVNILRGLTHRDTQFRMKINLETVLICFLVVSIRIPGCFRNGTRTCEFTRNSFNLDKSPKYESLSYGTPETISLSLSLQSPLTPEWNRPLRIWEQLCLVTSYSSNIPRDSLSSWLLALSCLAIWRRRIRQRWRRN